MSQGKTHLCPNSPLRKSPISPVFLGGKTRDLPPCGVLGGKNRGFFRKWFRLSILASRSRSSSLCDARKWFIQVLFFGRPVFFETQKRIASMPGRGDYRVDTLANCKAHGWPTRTLLSTLLCVNHNFLRHLELLSPHHLPVPSVHTHTTVNGLQH